MPTLLEIRNGYQLPGNKRVPPNPTLANNITSACTALGIPVPTDVSTLKDRAERVLNPTAPATPGPIGGIPPSDPRYATMKATVANAVTTLANQIDFAENRARGRTPPPDLPSPAPSDPDQRLIYDQLKALRDRNIHIAKDLDRIEEKLQENWDELDLTWFGISKEAGFESPKAGFLAPLLKMIFDIAATMQENLDRYNKYKATEQKLKEERDHLLDVYKENKLDLNERLAALNALQRAPAGPGLGGTVLPPSPIPPVTPPVTPPGGAGLGGAIGTPIPPGGPGPGPSGTPPVPPSGEAGLGGAVGAPTTPPGGPGAGPSGTPPVPPSGDAGTSGTIGTPTIPPGDSGTSSIDLTARRDASSGGTAPLDDLTRRRDSLGEQQRPPEQSPVQLNLHVPSPNPGPSLFLRTLSTIPYRPEPGATPQLRPSSSANTASPDEEQPTRFRPPT